MADDQHSDPSTEGVARAAQITAMVGGVLEALVRLRTQLTAERAQDDDRQAGAARAERLADHAAARVRWSPALENAWLQRAGAVDTAHAWGAARPWSDTDPAAETAMRRCEGRLRDLHPEAMRRFDELRHQGGAERAMEQAAPLFAAPSRQHALAGAPRGYEGPQSDRPRPRAAGELAARSYPYPITAGLAATSPQGGRRDPGRSRQQDLSQPTPHTPQRPLQPR